MFLVAEIFLLNYVLEKEYPDVPMTSQLCAEYLTWRGAEDISFKDVSESYEVIYANSGIVISKDNRVNIKDYSDFALPVDFTSASVLGVSSFFDDTFESFFEEYKGNCVFSMELCFDVSGGEQLDRDK